MPDSVWRSFRKPPEFAGLRREFLIFTKEEADELGMPYTSPWYTAESGDWVLTDDDYVMEMVRKVPFGDTGSYEIHFTGAKKIVDPKFVKSNQLLWEAYRDYPQRNVQYAVHTPRSKIEIFIRTKHCKRAFDLYVNLWLMRQSKLTHKDLVEFGRMAAPGDDRPYLRAKWLLKKVIVQKILMKKLSESLTGKDITFDNVVDTVQDAIKIAKDGKQPKQMLDGADFLYKMLQTASDDEGGHLPAEEDDWDYDEETAKIDERKRLVAANVEDEDFKNDEYEDYTDVDVYEERDSEVFDVKADQHNKK